jgi:hypothetical protein
MSYTVETKKIKRKFLGHKKHLVIQTEDGRILDHYKGEGKGIKKASFWDQLSFQGQKVVLDGKKYIVKKKSLNKYFIRNGTRLTFDRYGSKIHRAISRGLAKAIRFLPRKSGMSKKEMRGLMILKCIEHYAYPSIDGAHFPYDDEPANFRRNYRDSDKWEQFFISIWKGKKSSDLKIEGLKKK